MPIVTDFAVILNVLFQVFNRGGMVFIHIFLFDRVRNPFHATGLFIYPLKTENRGFLMFSGGIERD